MSYAVVTSACMHGATVFPVAIEVDIQPGLPEFKIIGLPDKQIDEARTRVKTAMKNSGIGFPQGRVTINLSPSNIPKRGTGLDLGMALGIVSAMRKRVLVPEGCWALGELALNGELRLFRQFVPLLIEAARTRVLGCVLPLCRVSGLSNLGLLPMQDLKECVRCLEENQGLVYPPKPRGRREPAAKPAYSLDQIIGQTKAKRALLIALAGGHNLFLTGPRGVGKSMLAQAAVELLPDLEGNALLELASLRSLRDHNESVLFDRRPPFRSPHHHISVAGMLGGGPELQPGELSWAHRGVLFLDEFPEFSRDVCEALREPLQNKQVNLQRQGLHCSFPADCIVIAAQNNCPCGLFGSKQKRCLCSQGQIRSYRTKLSQSLLDRFDLFCELDPVDFTEAPAKLGKDFAQAIRRTRSLARSLNTALAPEALAGWIPETAEIRRLLMLAQEKYLLSGRGLIKLQKVAVTIAQLAGEATVSPDHLREALQYRQNLEIP